MGQAKNRGTYEERVKQSQENKLKYPGQTNVGLAHDIQWAKLFAKLMAGTPEGKAGFAHLEPIKIITDTQEHYEAVFEDDMGKYNFIVWHKPDGYYVESSGMPAGPYNIERLLWEYEVQLSIYGPKVTQGRTYQGNGKMSWKNPDWNEATQEKEEA